MTSETSRELSGEQIARELASFVSEGTFESLPSPVVERVKRSILDVIGCGIYGSRVSDVGAFLSYIREQGQKEEASLLSGAGRISAYYAALANGTYVHTTELSEGFTRVCAHPGNCIVPSLLAIGERDRISGREFLVAACLGYEFNIRMGFSTGYNLLQLSGLHPPGVYGGLASAAACAKLLGLDEKGIESAIGIASCLTPTALMDAMTQQATYKDLFQGYSAAIGVMAGDLARSGMTGLADWVTPWYRAISKGYTLEPLTDRLNEFWHVSSGGLRVKTRPVMAMAQPVTWALFDMLSQNVVDPAAVTDILIESSERIALGRLIHPDNIMAARGSLPFLAAAAIVRRAEFISDPYMLNFLKTELFDDAIIQQLSEKIRLEANPEFDYNLERATPGEDPGHYIKFEGRVTVSLADGSELVAYKDVFEAGTGRMTRADIEAKFQALTAGSLAPAQAQEVIDTVWSLEDVPDTGKLASLFRAPSGMGGVTVT